MRDYVFFVYMLNSTSRRVLYTGMTNFLIGRVNQHRSQTGKRSFTAQYRAHRLVYYEEFADINRCLRREKEIKSWTRAKKNALVESINPKWHDLIAEWEEKYGLDFVVPIPPYQGRAARQQQQQRQTQGPSPASLRSLAQDDRVLLRNGEPIARLIPDNPKVCSGRVLAETVKEVALSSGEAAAWSRDLRRAKEKLMFPKINGDKSTNKNS